MNVIEMRLKKNKKHKNSITSIVEIFFHTLLSTSKFTNQYGKILLSHCLGTSNNYFSTLFYYFNVEYGKKPLFNVVFDTENI